MMHPKMTCRKPCFPTSAGAAERKAVLSAQIKWKNWADWSDWWGQWLVAFLGHCPGRLGCKVDLGRQSMAGRYGRVKSTAQQLLFPIRSKLLGFPWGQLVAHTEKKHWPTTATRNPWHFPSHISRCLPRTDFPMPVMKKDPCPSSLCNNTSKKTIRLFNFLLMPAPWISSSARDQYLNGCLIFTAAQFYSCRSPPGLFINKSLHVIIYIMSTVW